MKISNALTESAKSMREKDFLAVEKAIGQPLPSELRVLYALHNGGTPERRYLATDDGRELQFRGFRPIRHRRFDGDVLLEETYARVVVQKRLVPKDLIPFGDNDGGDLYCIHATSGEVFYRPMDGQPASKRTETPIATGLVDLLDRMVDEETL